MTFVWARSGEFGVAQPASVFTACPPGCQDCTKLGPVFVFDAASQSCVDACSWYLFQRSSADGKTCETATGAAVAAIIAVAVLVVGEVAITMLDKHIWKDVEANVVAE